MPSDRRPSEFLSAREAAERLGVSAATLYSYVSRGLVRSEAVGRERSRRYRAVDVEALVKRKEARSEPHKAVEGALHWGMPVLESGLSLISEGRLYYRGHDALDLARTASLEEVASLLWRGRLEALPESRAPQALSRRFEAVREAVRGLSHFERFQVLVPLAGAEDAAAYDLRPEAIAQTGQRLLRLMAAIVAGAPPMAEPVGKTLQRHWRLVRPETGRLIESALILAADHELNVSAFTARCVASAGASPYAAVAAGLAALGGTRHGGHCERVEALFRETSTPERAAACLASRLRRGEPVPGFGQPLYPQGDPRGRALLEQVADVFPGSPTLALGQALAEAGREVLGEEPTIDFGLALVCRALGLPEGTAIALFALGRVVGWIAHVLEQGSEGQLIRPRARYVGPLPIAPTAAGGVA